MKTSDEIRSEAWKTTRGGHWVLKFMLVFLVMSAIAGFVDSVWKDAAASMGIQTWSMFFDAKLKAIQSGLDLTVPSRTIALRMTEATAFETFVSCIIQGIAAFGICGLFLRAAKGDSAHWFSRAFGGFRCPLGLAWLYFRLMVQIALWLLPFIAAAAGFAIGLDKAFGWTMAPALSWAYARFYMMIAGVAVIVGTPAVIVGYRYAQSWNLKIENPDWSAGKCIAESCRMMKGNKWRRFKLDCSYWKPITLLLVVALVVVALIACLGAFPVPKELASLVVLALGTVLAWGGVVLVAYMSIGQALFYLDIKVGKEEVKVKSEEVRNCSTSTLLTSSF